jgi:hypothetical protein
MDLAWEGKKWSDDWKGRWYSVCFLEPLLSFTLFRVETFSCGFWWQWADLVTARLSSFNGLVCGGAEGGYVGRDDVIARCSSKGRGGK